MNPASSLEDDTEISYLEAIRLALRDALLADERVFLLGEDIGHYGGAFGATKGLWAEFGDMRVIDTPIAEEGFVGAAIGAAWMGQRPVVELQFADFVSCAFDMLVTGVVRGTFLYALERDLVAKNPCSLLRPKHLGEATAERPAHEWSDEEIERLLAASRALAREPNAKADYTDHLEFSIYTGLRRGELLGLEWRDVDWERGVIRVERQWTKYGEISPPKTKKGTREVPLSDGMVALLKNRAKTVMAQGHHRPESPVFASQPGGRLGHRNLSRRGFEAARDRAKLASSLRWHDMRHAFASLAAHRGVDIALVSKVMGHANVAITLNTYSHLFNPAAAVEVFRKAMGGEA